MDAVRKKFENLGLKDALSLLFTARKGVRPSVFYSFANTVGMSERNLAELLHMHPRTVSNYRDQQKHLSPVESEHLLKLIRLFAKGEELFGSIDDFNQWLQRPFLKNKETPMDWLNTPGGVDLIGDELERMAHGYVA